MEPLLLLTGDEQKMFSALSAKIRDGWTVQNVTVTQEEDEDLAVRLRMADFDTIPLRSFAQQLQTAKTSQDYMKAAAVFDFRTLDPEQMAELFFVLGVKTLTGFIGYLLLSAQTDEDIQGVSSLSQIRQMLSDTNTHS